MKSKRKRMEKEYEKDAKEREPQRIIQQEKKTTPFISANTARTLSKVLFVQYGNACVDQML
jgi:hypothetical protein